MASFTLAFDSIYLPMPRAAEPFRMEYMPFGSERRMANATLRVQYVGSRWRVVIFWEGLTKTERDLCWTTWGGYIATAALVYLPDGLSFTGMTALGSWAEAHWYDPHDGSVRYNVSFAVEQV